MSHVTLPSGATAELTAMSANEELLLRDQKLLRKGLAVDRVMEKCVTKINDKDEVAEEDFLTLTALDRSVLLLELRKESYGSELAIAHLCVNPSCGTSMDLTFNLDDITIHQPMTDQPVDLDLPSGAKVTVQPLSGRAERELTRLADANEHDILLKCLVTLNGESPSRERFLKLPSRDLVTLRRCLKDQFGWVDDIAQVRCKECGTVNRISLLTHPGFLFPEM